MTAEDTWSYLDLNNEVQGPFTETQMVEWWEAGYLWPELKAKRTSETEYKALKQRPEFSPRDVKKKEKNDRNKEDEDAQDSDPLSGTIWFYQDDNGSERGPFPFADMKAWILAGYLKRDLKVRKNTDEEGKHKALGDTDEFNKTLVEHAAEQYKRQAPVQTDYGRPLGAPVPLQFVEYNQVASFNLRGHFASEGVATQFQAKGYSNDTGARQMSHYFDIEAYQEAKRAAKRDRELNPAKRPKWYKKKTKKIVYAWQTDLVDPGQASAQERFGDTKRYN